MLRTGTFALTALLAGLTAIGPLTTDMYLPSMPDIARLLGTNASGAQLTLSVFLVGFAVGQVFHGPLSDRFGRKIVLVAALGIYALATLAAILASSIEWLILARAAQGVGGSSGIVLARAIVRDIYSGAQAGRQLSLIASVMALAPVLAPMGGGALHVAFGWRSIFVVLLIGALAGMVAVWFLLPETNKNTRPEPFSLKAMLQSYGVLIRNPAYLAYLSLGTFTYAGLFAWLSGSSFVLQDIVGLTPLHFGVAFSVGAVGYMLGSAISARIVVRLGLNGLTGLGCCCCATGGLAMVAAVALGFTSAWTLMGAIVIYLAGLAMVLAQSIAGAMTPFPERAGAASSLFGVVQQTLAAVCGVLIGAMVGHSAMPLALMIAAMGVASLVAWFVTRDIRRAASVHH